MLLKLLSAVYMLRLAWKIATASPKAPGAAAGRPLTFVQAAAFQWVNPKAWALALSPTTLYSPGPSAAAMAQVALVFCLINLPSVWTCAALGQLLRRWLARGERLRRFNRAMALLLLAFLWPVLMH